MKIAMALALAVVVVILTFTLMPTPADAEDITQGFSNTRQYATSNTYLSVSVDNYMESVSQLEETKELKEADGDTYLFPFKSTTGITTINYDFQLADVVHSSDTCPSSHHAYCTSYYHNAVDIGPADGTGNIYAVCSGKVEYTHNICNGLWIRGVDGYLWGYLHMASYSQDYQVGDTINKGDLIGTMGGHDGTNTHGYATHLDLRVTAGACTSGFINPISLGLWDFQGNKVVQYNTSVPVSKQRYANGTEPFYMFYKNFRNLTDYTFSPKSTNGSSNIVFKVDYTSGEPEVVTFEDGSTMWGYHWLSTESDDKPDYLKPEVEVTS